MNGNAFVWPYRSIALVSMGFIYQEKINALWVQLGHVSRGIVNILLCILPIIIVVLINKMVKTNPIDKLWLLTFICLPVLICIQI